MNTQVSIIVPVYNAERYLRECVDSLLRQTYSNTEIVLVNDGSVDSSAALCDGYAEQNANVRVIHQPNSGAAAARQTGVLNAVGDYIMFVDADDWLDPGFLACLVDEATTHNPDVVVATFQRYTEQKCDIYHHFFSPGFYDLTKLHEEIFPQMLSASPYYTFGIAPSMWAKLFRREIVLKSIDTLFDNITFGEDACFTYCALLNCQSLFISNANGYIYRDNEGSATRNFRLNLLEDPQKIYHFYQGLSEKYGWDCQKQVEEYMVGVCQHIAFRAVRSLEYSKIKKQLTRCIKENFPKSISRSKIFETFSFQQRIIYRLVCGCHWWLLKRILSFRG